MLLLLLLVATPTDETTCEEIKLRFLRRRTTARFSARSAGLGSKNIRRNMLSHRIAYHLSGLVTLVNLGLCGHWNGLAFFCGGTVEFLCHKDRSAHPLCDDSVYFVSIEPHSGPVCRSAGQPGQPATRDLRIHFSLIHHSRPRSLAFTLWWQSLGRLIRCVAVRNSKEQQKTHPSRLVSQRVKRSDRCEILSPMFRHQRR